VDRQLAFACGPSETAGPSLTLLRSSRDDKVEVGGPPWHEWRWMDRFEKANLDNSDSQPSPSTSSGQALRDWSGYMLIAFGELNQKFEKTDLDNSDTQPVPWDWLSERV
jgi:hypothetical protein